MEQSKRIVLLGASGKLGQLSQAAWRDNPPQGLTLLPFYRGPACPADATQWQPYEDSPLTGPVDVVVALWGVTPGPSAILSDNKRLALEAQRLGAVLNADRVLHCSTAAVYKPVSHLLSEATPPDPQNDYGRAKLNMESALHEWAEKHPDGPRSCIMRIGNVAGADSLFAAINAGAGVQLDKFPDGQGPRRSYISPEDFLQSVMGLVRCDPDELPTVLNVSAPKATPMQDIAQAAGCEITWRDAPESANSLVELDTTRLERIVHLPASSAEPERLLQSWKGVR